ncbi:unnamed protein product [Sphagnum jensenii]|uniref:Uncharacterized protein n=1 Tax=Sphagnum jensenii TaxID=128206 RepID=A0ABP0WL42_9BRYO
MIRLGQPPRRVRLVEIRESGNAEPSPIDVNSSSITVPCRTEPDRSKFTSPISSPKSASPVELRTPSQCRAKPGPIDRNPQVRECRTGPC